jgi:hypothetical protein
VPDRRRELPGTVGSLIGSVARGNGQDEEEAPPIRRGVGRQSVEQHASDASAALVGTHRHQRDLCTVVEPRLDRQEAHDLAVALGREPRLNPNCGCAIAPPLVVTEVVRQGRNDGITRLGVPLSKPTDQHRHTFTLPIRHPAKDQKLVEPTHESAVQTEAGEALRYTSGYELRRWRCDRYARMMRAVPALGEMMVSCPSPHLTWYRTLNSPTVTFTTSPSRAGEPT